MPTSENSLKAKFAEFGLYEARAVSADTTISPHSPGPIGDGGLERDSSLRQVLWISYVQDEQTDYS
jgi:hypothetical protein